MKCPPSLTVSLFSVLLLAVLPAVASAAPDDDNVGVAIHQTGRLLVFPPEMLAEGVEAGEVQVVLSVDAQGKLTDLLIVGYSNPGFADAVANVLPTWSFEPARLHGRPQASRLDLDITFSSEVNVMVVNLTLHYWERVTGAWRRFVYKTYRLVDLDRIPTPTQIVRPTLPNGEAPASDETVTVEFFIDERGKVRVPTCDREQAGDRYAAAAIAAVEQWHFEAPQRHGRPVLVLARQDFTFKAKH